MAGESSTTKSIDSRIARLEGGLESLSTSVSALVQTVKDEREERRGEASAIFRKIDSIQAKPFPWVIIGIVLTVMGGMFTYVVTGIQAGQTEAHEERVATFRRMTVVEVESAKHQAADDARDAEQTRAIASLEGQLRREIALHEQITQTKVEESARRFTDVLAQLTSRIAALED